MSLDRRRLGDAAPTAKFNVKDKLAIYDDKNVHIAAVTITGRIRDHSISVTDSVGGKSQITFVGREIRYKEFHAENREKVWRNVRIEAEAE